MKQLNKSWLTFWSLGIALSLSALDCRAGEQASGSAPMTVLAMLKAESDVLAKWHVQQAKVSGRRPPKPSLVSIYGVLPQLRARVLINGREVVFEQGRRQPLYPKTGSIQLRDIEPPCVRFAQGSRLQTVCLSQVGS